MPNNMILLETIALTQSAASVTFDNLPTSGYTDLKIVMSARSDRSSFTSTYLNVSFNNSTSGYSSRVLVGNGTSALSYTNIEGTTGMGVMVFSQANNTANTFGNGELYILNYAGSTNKSVSADSVQESNETTGWQFLGAGLWSNTSAITSIKLQPISGGTNFSFLAGSTFSLYGIAALGTTPVTAPKATGGNIVANDGTYWYHAFTSSGNFVPQVGLTADVLQIAGGAGGGSDGNGTAGGGGAGGLLLHSAQSLVNGTNYACTVGAGGPGGTFNGVDGNGDKGGQGNNSQFAALTASVGGGGGGNQRSGRAAGNGGSGGGGSRTNTTAGTGTTGQGNNGGAGIANSGGYFPSGGGGGAGAAGGNAATNLTGAGAGGAGLSTYSSWGLATLTGQNVSGTYWYAGGGGGAMYNQNAQSGTGGAGGNGGGGVGGYTQNAPASSTGGNGIANTGGGGGGSANYTGQSSNNGGAGGSGVIIIRYPIA